MGRREMREHIFKLLFLREFNEAEEMPQQIKLYFDAMEDLGPTEQAYMEDKYGKVREHLEEIDNLLNEKSTGWKTKRMSKVDLNILRLAVYEMKYDLSGMLMRIPSVKVVRFPFSSAPIRFTE